MATKTLLFTLTLFLTLTIGLAKLPDNTAPSNTHCEKYADTISKLIEKFLENLRSHMSTGIPSLGIPPLDPLQIPDSSVVLKKPYQYDLSGRIASSKLEGLKYFNVTKISTSIFHMQANISLSIPYVFLTGTYTLKGRALELIPIKGKGPYIIKPSYLNTSVTTSLQLTHGHVQMTSMDFKIQVTDLYAHFEGLFGGSPLSNIANSLMNRFGVSVFRRIEPKVHERVRVALLAEINSLLKDIPIATLLGSISTDTCRSAVTRMLVEHV